MNAPVATEVAILRRKPSAFRDWEYTLYCQRCTRSVYGARTSCFTTKASAKRVATEHNEMHLKRDSTLSKWIADGTFELAGMVPA